MSEDKSTDVWDTGLVIEQVDAVAIFPNQDGGITIMQRDYMGDHAMVIFPVDRLPKVIKALQEIKKSLLA